MWAGVLLAGEGHKIIIWTNLIKKAHAIIELRGPKSEKLRYGYQLYRSFKQLQWNWEATHKFCFDKSCGYLLGGADIVIFNPNGILVMDMKEFFRW